MMGWSAACKGSGAMIAARCVSTCTPIRTMQALPGFSQYNSQAQTKNPDLSPSKHSDYRDSPLDVGIPPLEVGGVGLGHTSELRILSLWTDGTPVAPQ